MRASDGDLAGGILFSFAAAGFIDPVQHFAHVLDLLEKGSGHENRFFMRGGNGKTITGPGVELDDFPRHFVLLLQNQPRKIGRIFQIRDDDAFHGNPKTLEHPIDEVVGEWTFLGFLTEEHLNDRADLWFDVDDKNLFVVANKQRATAVGGKNPPNLDWHDFILSPYQIPSMPREDKIRRKMPHHNSHNTS